LEALFMVRIHAR